MRKHYIDNLRNYTIILLFPVHTFMIWNNFGSGFYIHAKENLLLSTFITMINPWFMPLLFVLAGISAKHSLEKRSDKEFIRQRADKLLIPFIFGTILSAPLQTFFARKFSFGYNGSYFENIKYFFTHFTDLSGYDGAFTPAHLWFILFLFVISAVSLIFFRFIPYEKVCEKTEKFPLYGIMLLFLPIYIMYHIGNFGGYSLGKYLTLFLIGYYFFSSDALIDKLEKNSGILTIFSIILIAVSAVLYYNFSYYGDLWVNFSGWMTILAVIGSGKKYLNKKTIFTDYLNHASYPIYILHQPILVALAYYVLKIETFLSVQVLMICFGSLAITILAYHIIKPLPLLRKLIGIK